MGSVHGVIDWSVPWKNFNGMFYATTSLVEVQAGGTSPYILTRMNKTGRYLRPCKWAKPKSLLIHNFVISRNLKLHCQLNFYENKCDQTQYCSSLSKFNIIMQEIKLLDVRCVSIPFWFMTTIRTYEGNLLRACLTIILETLLVFLTLENNSYDKNFKS